MPPARRAMLALVIAAGFAPAAAPPRAVSFRDDVFPILSRHCLRCHRGTNPASGVRLDARDEILGENSGKPLTGRLLDAVRGHQPDRVMPPEGRGKRLAPAQIDTLRSWIDQGLAWDDAVLPPPGPPDHRFFRPVRRPPVPRPGPSAIDAFLADARERLGLRTVGEAPRRVLLRRLTLDLTGLPPTVGEQDAFLNDRRPDAYERLVERLLASPAYGERWGRHWLDVARFAESEGYESNHPRPYAWRYRDWVIAAFNRDLPFADFVRLQLAGDEVRPYADDNLVATGFLAAARLSSNEEDMPRQRNDMLVDVVNTTASAFLGLTFGCAQCHNHKFDPVTARDYYRFQAFFVRGQPGNLALAAPEARRRWLAALPAGYLDAKKRLEGILAASRARLMAALIANLPADEGAALAVNPGSRSDDQERLARRAELKLQVSTGRVEREVAAEDRAEYDALKKRLAGWDGTVPDEPQTFGYLAPATAAAPVRVLPMRGFYPLAYDPERLRSLRAHLLVGGNVHQRGPAVEPGWPALFGPTRSLAPTPRLTLAAWLTSPDHPLTARVWVNRLWAWHFGRGLVATAGDFGTRGAAASHPELLDWLASEFFATGSTKHVQRLIVTSEAYRLASTPDAANAAIDADNVYRWRWSPRRLESETIRDAMLAAAGDLDRRGGGPGDEDEAAGRRRGVYLLQKRDRPAMINGLFDGPAACAESLARRGTSTVPLQALYLLNHPFAVARAAALADRVRPLDPERRVTAVFRLALGRPPEADERGSCRAFLAGGGTLEALCQAVLNLNEFAYLE